MPHRLFLSTFSISPEGTKTCVDDCEELSAEMPRNGPATRTSAPTAVDTTLSTRIQDAFTWMERQPTLNIQWQQHGMQRTLILTGPDNRLVGQGESLLAALEMAMLSTRNTR